MSTAPPAIPADDPKRNLTLTQPDNLPHIGLVGDTYTCLGGETRVPLSRITENNICSLLPNGKINAVKVKTIESDVFATKDRRIETSLMLVRIDWAASLQ